MESELDLQCRPQYRLLSEGQIKAIHEATLDLLNTIGVRVFSQEGVELLKKAGCRDGEKNTIQIPPHLVEESIQSAPSGVSIFNRKGEEALRLEGRQVYFGLGTDLLTAIDLETSEWRPCQLKDVVNAAMTGDAIDEIDFIASMAHPQDVLPNLAYIASFRALVENSTKPIFFTAAGKEDLSTIIEMAETVAGSEEALREKPFLIHYAEPTSPLCHSHGALRKLFLCADKKIPVTYTPAVLAGATGPVTLAGAIIQANAEALSGLVLHQLRSKGAPIISGFAVTPMDMRTATCAYGSPDYRLALSACADLYHYYGIPVWGTAGCSDANILDQQAAMECSLSILTAALDGANLVHDVGYLGQGSVGSPATIVMCSEIISYVKRLTRGGNMGDDRIATEVIREVGPGGSFLAEEHTLRFLREEQWRPKYFNRDGVEIWQTKGGKSYGEVVTEKAREILRTHKPERLPESVLNRLAQIAQKAEADLLGKTIVS